MGVLCSRPRIGAFYRETVTWEQIREHLATARDLIHHCEYIRNTVRFLKHRSFDQPYIRHSSHVVIKIGV